MRLSSTLKRWSLPMANVSAVDVLTFWFSKDVIPLQFVKDPVFDQQIIDRFLPAYEEAVAGDLDDWMQTAEGCLGLIILLDQFPRNMFRDMPKAFASDSKALTIAVWAVDAGFEDCFPVEQRKFFYLPFMHSEILADQDYSVSMFADLGLEVSLKFAIAHRDIIARFGRFPHRNQILGRSSTEEEIKFLKGPNSHF